ncbi:MAG: hypothetical protein U5K79_13110 [Cyclobacteriaceae bacterium]|nr:hypothetical protein [Cyclobacteriaceae bacterium]
MQHLWTSNQSRICPLKRDDIYLSWIGSGLGIGVQSGLSFFSAINKSCLDLFEGWQVYRDYLNSIPGLSGNQISTWNGQWIAHRYYKVTTYDAVNPTASFNPFGAMKMAAWRSIASRGQKVDWH